jgi:hypothetical protein
MTTSSSMSVKLDGNMILLRRLSTKDDPRRLIAAPMPKEDLPFPWIGIENHLNYIYRPEHPRLRMKPSGLAAVLNSSLLDKHFRICNGNTHYVAAFSSWEFKTIWRRSHETEGGSRDSDHLIHFNGDKFLR